MSALVLGVVAPESIDDGLSVHIFSRSLSDSSPMSLLMLVLYLLDRGNVKDRASGLWSRPSEVRGGARRLGRRNLWMRGLFTSSEGDEKGVAEDDA